MPVWLFLPVRCCYVSSLADVPHSCSYAPPLPPVLNLLCLFSMGTSGSLRPGAWLGRCTRVLRISIWTISLRLFMSFFLFLWLSVYIQSNCGGIQCTIMLSTIQLKCMDKIIGGKRSCTFWACQPLLHTSLDAGKSQPCVLRIIHLLTPVRSLQGKHTEVDYNMTITGNLQWKSNLGFKWDGERWSLAVTERRGLIVLD